MVTTIVRASQQATQPGTLRLGIRTSVRTPAGVSEGRVLILDGVDFFASREEIHQRVTDLVRDDVHALLAKRGERVAPDRIVLRIFGGVW